MPLPHDSDVVHHAFTQRDITAEDVRYVISPKRRNAEPDRNSSPVIVGEADQQWEQQRPAKNKTFRCGCSRAARRLNSLKKSLEVFESVGLSGNSTSLGYLNTSCFANNKRCAKPSLSSHHIREQRVETSEPHSSHALNF